MMIMACWDYVEHLRLFLSFGRLAWSVCWQVVFPVGRSGGGGQELKVEERP